MIDIDDIEEEKPRKGPKKMRKSEKDQKARRRGKLTSRRQRLSQQKIHTHLGEAFRVLYQLKDLDEELEEME